ncbi:MAG: hypothetical protein MUC42_07695 [Bryobacter sp.]|jgi:hypothetical protein|nr:hypothetical protein [Bryobacter sp.]
MQLKSLMCVCAAAAALVTASAPAGAHVISNGTRAKIPFDFVVAGKTLRAGNYTLELNANQYLVTIRGERGDSAISFLERSGAATNETLSPRLTFQKKDGKFVLREVRAVK